MTSLTEYHDSANVEQSAGEPHALNAGFTKVPNAVLRNPELSMPAKCVYGLLLSYAWNDPYSYPGLERLRGDTGAKISTIRKYITELEDADFIEVKRRGLNHTNRYVFRPLDPVAEPGYPSSGGIQTTPQWGISGPPSTGEFKKPLNGGYYEDSGVRIPKALRRRERKLTGR